MDIEQIANIPKEPEQIPEPQTSVETYQPMTVPPVDPQIAVDQAELDILFANEVQTNVFKALFSLINIGISKYVVIQVDNCSNVLTQNPYMKKYFAKRFGGLTSGLPEEVRAAIVVGTHIMVYSDPVEPEEIPPVETENPIYLDPPVDEVTSD